MKDLSVKRGDITLVNLDSVIGSEQGKTRPAVIIQNDIGNEFSPITIIAPITSKIYSKEFPTNVEISPDTSGLKERSTILTNQIRAIDKERIVKRIGHLNEKLIESLNEALKSSLGLD